MNGIIPTDMAEQNNKGYCVRTLPSRKSHSFGTAMPRTGTSTNAKITYNKTSLVMSSSQLITIKLH